MELKDLAGAHKLSGVDYSCAYDVITILFCLDGITYEAISDPADGYRSYMKELSITEKRCKNIFQPQDVICVWKDNVSGYDDDDDVLFIYARNGLTVLEIGTREASYYYPYCVMEYTPENLSCNGAI